MKRRLNIRLGVLTLWCLISLFGLETLSAQADSLRSLPEEVYNKLPLVLYKGVTGISFPQMYGLTYMRDRYTSEVEYSEFIEGKYKRVTVQLDSLTNMNKTLNTTVFEQSKTIAGCNNAILFERALASAAKDESRKDKRRVGNLKLVTGISIGIGLAGAAMAVFK